MLNANAKSNFVTLTLGVGSRVHCIIFRYTLLLNIIEMHNEDEKKWSETHLLNVFAKRKY